MNPEEQFITQHQSIVGAGGGGGGSSAGGGGGKGNSGSPEQTTEQPTTIQSRSYLNALFLLCEGDIDAPYNYTELLKNVYLDQTPIKNEDGSSNFEGVKAHFRRGTPNQGHIPGFGAAKNEEEVGVEVSKTNNDIVRQVNDANTDAVQIRVVFPALQKVEDDGDIKGTSVSFAISIRDKNGNYQERVRDTVSEKFSSPYERSYRIDLHGEAPWNIKFTRLTPDSDSSKLKNRTIWQSFTTIVDNKFRYPNSALLALRISAEQFNNLPEVTYKARFKRIRYPSNYDPNTREYRGDWDGSFNYGFCNNPAWVFYDLMTDDRYGVGNFIDTKNIDKWSLYAVGQYCDEKVPDGRGGHEPRFTLNGSIESREDAFKVLNTVASVFRGAIYWSQGTIFTTQDRPGNPVKIFTEANVVQEVDDDGEITSPPFNYSSSSRTARHTVAIVTFHDPDNFYKASTEYVEDSEGLLRYGYNPTEITAFGCTSRAQARRLGLWKLATERWETSTVTFKTGMEGANVKPGEIIYIQDPLVSNKKWGGRVLNYDSTAITLDKTPDLNLSNNPELKIANEDGYESKPILTQDGNTVTVPSPYRTDYPNGVWIITEDDRQKLKYRVFTVSEQSDMTFEITATSYVEDKYDYIDYGDPVELPPAGQQFPRVPAKPWNLQISIDPVYVNGSWKFNLRGSWEQPVLEGNSSPFTTSYQVQIKKDELGSWQSLSDTNSTTVTYDRLEKGRYFFRVRARDVLGRYSSWVESVAAETDKPQPRDPNGTARVTTLNQGGVVITWSDTTRYTYGIEQYRIEIDGELHELVPSDTRSSSPIDLEPGYYEVIIKAVDFAGSISEGGVETSIGDENVVPNPQGEITYRLRPDKQFQIVWTDSQSYPKNYAGYKLYINGTAQHTTLLNHSPYFDREPGEYNIELYAYNTNGYESQDPLTLNLTEDDFVISPPIGEISKKVATSGLAKIIWTDTQDYNGLLGGYKVFVAGEQVDDVPADQKKESRYIEIPDLGSEIKVTPYSKTGELANDSLVTTNQAISSVLPNPEGEVTKHLLADGGVQFQWTDTTQYPPIFEGYRVYIDDELAHTTLARQSQSIFYEKVEAHDVHIVPYASDGGESLEGYTAHISKDDYYPPQPNYLLVEQSSKGTKRLNWGELNNPADLRLYRVKYNTGVNYDWENAHPLEDVPISSTSYESDLFRADVYTILVKTVDTTGLESPGSVYASVSLVDPVPENLVESVDFYDRKAPTGEGIIGRYYEGTGDSKTKEWERTDEKIDFDWGSGSPSHNGTSLSSDYFTTEWEGSFKPRYSDDYTLEISNDGDATLTVEGSDVATITDGGTTTTSTMSLTAGQHYKFRYIVEHKDQNPAYAKLSWSSKRQVKQPIPNSHFYKPVTDPWEGNKTNMAVDSNGYLAVQDNTLEAEFDSEFDISNRGDLKVDYNIDGNYALYYNQASPYRLWEDDSDTLWKDDSETLWEVQDRFLPLTSGTRLDPGLYRLKVKFKPSDQGGLIQHFKALIDVPDITEKFQDVEVPANGLRLAPSNDLQVLKAVNVTLQDVDNGDMNTEPRTVRVKNKNPDIGAEIECLDDSGSRTIGTVDVIYVGY